MNDNAIPDKALAPAAKVSVCLGSKADVGRMWLTRGLQIPSLPEQSPRWSMGVEYTREYVTLFHSFAEMHLSLSLSQWIS